MEPVSFAVGLAGLIPVCQLAESAVKKIKRYKRQFKFARLELRALEHDTSDFSTLLFSAKSNLQRLDAFTKPTELESRGFAKILAHAEKLIQGFLRFLLEQKRLYLSTGGGMFAFLKRYWAGRKWNAAQHHITFFQGRLRSVKGSLGLLLAIVNMRMTIKLLEEALKNPVKNEKDIEALRYDIKLAKIHIRRKNEEIKSLESELKELENHADVTSNVQSEIEETSQVIEAVKDAVRVEAPDCDPYLSRLERSRYLNKSLDLQPPAAPVSLPLTLPYTDESQGTSSFHVVPTDSTSTRQSASIISASSSSLQGPSEIPGPLAWVVLEEVGSIESTSISDSDPESPPGSAKPLYLTSTEALVRHTSKLAKAQKLASDIGPRGEWKFDDDSHEEEQQQSSKPGCNAIEIRTAKFESSEIGPPEIEPTEIEAANTAAPTNHHAEKQQQPPSKPASPSIETVSKIQNLKIDNRPVHYQSPPPHSSLSKHSGEGSLPPILKPSHYANIQSYAPHGRLDRDKLREEYYQKLKAARKSKRLRLGKEEEEG